MKKICFIFLFVMLLLNVQAQDLFSSIEEMVGKEFRIYPLPASFVNISEILYYRTPKGKFKSLKKTAFDYESLYNRDFRAVQIVNIKKKRYLEFEGSESFSFYFLIDRNKDFCSFLRSVTYWKEKLDCYSEKYAYINVNKPLFEESSGTVSCLLENDKYVPIHWIGLKMPEAQNKDGEVLFCYSICEVEKGITDRSLKEKGSESFVSQKQFDAYLIQYKNQIVAQERRDSLEDYILIEATLQDEFSCRDSEGELRTIQSGTSLPIYKIEEDKACTLFLGNKLSVPLSGLVFQDSLKRNFLQKRGDRGMEVRKQVALQKDSLYTGLVMDNLNQELFKIQEQIAAKIKEFSRKEIFLFLQKYSYSDNRFGLKFRFYNCFKKSIKYIHVTIRSYNQVYDIQCDDLGRTTANVRCIGPVKSGEQVDFDFDELFWDENDIIRYLYVTNIKFTFMDNTTRVFSGKKTIDAHRCMTYDDHDF